jgi:hypothetical protein
MHAAVGNAQNRTPLPSLQVKTTVLFKLKQGNPKEGEDGFLYNRSKFSRKKERPSKLLP